MENLPMLYDFKKEKRNFSKIMDIDLIMERINYNSEKTILRYIGITQGKMDKLVEEFNL